MTNVVKLKKDRQGPDAATMPRDASPEVIAARAYLNTMIELGQVISHRKKVDPALAAAMLERNQGNVPLVPADIAKYAKDMADGKWYDTGDPFAFSTDGILINGQHRAKAIIKSGVTIEAMVQFGNDPKTRFVSDTGRVNTSTRILAAHGYRNAGTKLQIALWARRVLNNEFDEKGRAKSMKISNEEAVLELSKHAVPDVEDALKIANKLYRFHRRPGRSVFGGMYLAMKMKDDTATQLFFEALLQEKGQGFAGDGDPAMHVNKRLMTENTVRGKTHTEWGKTQSSVQTICAIIIKGFNSYRIGKQVLKVQWHPNGRGGSGGRSVPEPFPTIGGAVTDDDGEE